MELLKLQEELKLAHPEKFSAQALRRLNRNPVVWRWLWCGFVLLVGLGMLYWPQSLAWLIPWLIVPLFGLGIGAFIGAMSCDKLSGWKRAYRGMRSWSRFTRFFAWIGVALFGFVFFSLLFQLCDLIVHPGRLRDPAEHGFALFACGLVAGWLLVHLRLGWRKAS